MAYSSLLATKFYVPPVRPTLIHRPRLLERLANGLGGPFTLISAPAGYGKTTLFSEWRTGPGASVQIAWLSLDIADNDPLRFYQYLLTSLDAIQPGGLQDILPLLQSPEPPNYETILTLLVNILSEKKRDFVLALDDYHVIEASAIHTALTFLLDHRPPHMHLVMLSRTDPPLPLARLRARDQILEIRESDLRFTPDEISAFLNEIMGLNLSAEDLSALELRTEGWIAGLQLAALSMQSCHDLHGFISAFTGSHHYVMDYLTEEVLNLQPKKMGSFLLQTSILDRLCGPLCEAVVEADTAGPVDGQGMLEALEGMNLFVIPLDDERRWYRYHHLFADVLRKRLERQFPHLVPEIHRRASEWYEQNGFLAESIQHAIAAGDQDRAAHLIEENGCLLLMSGEVATLLSWADAIEFQSEARPWLAVQKAWALALTGDLERVEPTLQVPEKLLAPLEHTVEVRILLGTIAAARAHCANSRENTLLAAEYARNALNLLPDSNSLCKSIRSVLVSILGDASWINGDFEEASRAYTEAIRIGKEANNLHMVIIANSNIVDMQMRKGQLHLAADTYAHTLQMAVRPDGQRSPLAARLFAGLGELFYEWNQLDEAEQAIHQCMELSRIWGDYGQQAYAYTIQARLDHARNNPEQALEALRRAEQLIAEHPPSPRWSIHIKYELARIWLALGYLEKASQRIEKSGLQIKDEIPYRQEAEYLLLLRVLLSKSDYGAAITLSSRLLQLAQTTGLMGLVVEVLILQALALQGMKETEQALAVLERALTLAQSEGYLRIFLDEGETITRLLCQVQSRQVGSGYAAVLLSGIEKTSAMAQPSMQLLAQPLTAREVEVLKLIKAGCSNQDIADQLVISIPTVKRHISNIYTKLGVESRTQAVSIGTELKIF
jgi:LuxR family transcriptional regulator, maltose regulon positive regulatory protein